jgi:4-amino-4-deoxy-L-arabinose transferase-like glycosyltransferase
MQSPKNTFVIFLIVLVAFLVRLGFTAVYRGGLDQPPTHARCAADGVEYDSLARNVAAGNGYCLDGGGPTSFRAPGLPFAMAAVYGLFGPSLTAIHVLFSFCGACGVLSAYCLATELVAPRTARFAAAFAALYPGDIYMASNFFSELVFSPCLGFGLWLLARNTRTGSRWAALGAGVLLGYASLTRSFAVLFLPLYVLYCLSGPILRMTQVRAATWYTVGFALVLLPWVARNYQVHGTFVLVATNGGSTFYGGNNDVVTSTPRQYGNWVATNGLPGRDLIDAQPTEVSHDKMEYQLGVAWVKAHPMLFVKMSFFKIARSCLPFVDWPSLKVYPIANIGTTTPFLLLIGLGLWTTLRSSAQRKQFALCHLAMYATLVVVVVFYGTPRFRDANLPVLAVYGAVAMDRLLKRN